MKKKLPIFFLVLLMIFTLIPPMEAEAAQKVKINKTKTTIYVGSTETLKVTGTSKKATWSSSDKKIATVSSKGKVTAKKAGTATITAKVSGKKYKCTVTVKKPSINATKKTLYVGKSYTLKLTGTSIKSVKTSNSKVATVSKKGKVVAKKAGTATITLTGKDGKKYTCKVTVKKPSLNATQKTLEVGKTYTLKLTGATVKSFKSSKTSVATVNSKGKITAKKSGTATITVTDTNGKTYKCTVTVKSHKHTWNTGVVTTKATCAKEGVTTYTCTGCGKTKTESIAKTTTHAWNEGVVTKEPTYKEKGEKTYTCTICKETKTEPIDETGTPSEEDYIQMFYETYGGSWDTVGTDVGAGMCTGRSLYTNSVYNTSFEISTETRVCNDRFIVDMNDAKPSDGVITECIDDGSIWLAGTTDFDLYLYTSKNTKWSVKSETSFINSYAEKYKENYANSYDEITFGEIYTMDIGGNTYYCVDHLDMNVRDIGNIYYYETLLVRKCDDKMLVYYINDSNNQIGVDSGGVTETYIREHILY